MLAAYTKLQHAEKVKQYLLQKKVLHPGFLPVKELGLMYFPLLKTVKVPNAKLVDTKFTFSEKPGKVTIEMLLKNTLTTNELKFLPKSQENVGSILIIEIPDELEKKENSIAKAYLKHNPHITTVVKKSAIHKGTYRTREVRILAGKRTKETIHVENGVRIKLHLEKTYFSSRLANERLRIAKLVKKNESVLVMFSGAAPYLLVLAKHSPAKMIYGIEINPLAHQYALQNVSLNKFNHKIAIFQGDVRTILPRIKKKFDRIVMPLPKTGDFFLDVALKHAKPDTVIHFYTFLDEKDINKEVAKIKERCKNLKHPVRILRKVKCGQFSPGKIRLCLDMKVLK